MSKTTQKERVLQILRDANGGYVDGIKVFLHQEYISQFHARIKELQGEGYDIKGQRVAGENWKEYRLLEQGQAQLFNIPARKQGVTL